MTVSGQPTSMYRPEGRTQRERINRRRLNGVIKNKYASSSGLAIEVPQLFINAL